MEMRWSGKTFNLICGHFNSFKKLSFTQPVLWVWRVERELKWVMRICWLQRVPNSPWGSWERPEPLSLLLFSVASALREADCWPETLPPHTPKSTHVITPNQHAACKAHKSGLSFPGWPLWGHTPRPSTKYSGALPALWGAACLLPAAAASHMVWIKFCLRKQF